jgi:PBP1b-binding outer membrane lipoprotein LpoB
MGKIGGLVLIAALALTGCSAAPESTAPAAEPVVSVTTVKSDLVVMRDATDATIQAMANSICKLYASGKSDAEVTALVIAASANVQIGDDGLKVARAAVKTQCPEFG